MTGCDLLVRWSAWHTQRDVRLNAVNSGIAGLVMYAIRIDLPTRMKSNTGGGSKQKWWQYGNRVVSQAFNIGESGVTGVTGEIGVRSKGRVAQTVSDWVTYRNDRVVRPGNGNGVSPHF